MSDEGKKETVNYMYAVKMGSPAESWFKDHMKAFKPGRVFLVTQEQLDSLRDDVEVIRY